ARAAGASDRMAAACVIRWAIGSLLNGRDAGFDDDVAPFGRLGGDELGELLRRGGNAFRALLDDLSGYRRILDRADELLIELGDARLGRAVGGPIAPAIPTPRRS